MKKNYENVIPKKYHNVSYETDVSNVIKLETTKQIKNREGLYLWGEPGCGKTHIACALTKTLLEQGIDVMFLNTGDFLERVREEYNKVFEDEEYKGLFREVMDFEGILIFDDIGAEKVSEWTRERLYLIVNKKWEDMYPMIFTSNCDIEVLSARLGDRITSRIAGMTTRIMIPGVDKRITQKSNETN